MGSTSSKAARKLPKTPPSWAGTRTPHPDFAAQGRDAEAGATRAERNPHHTASETRTHGGPVTTNETCLRVDVRI